jgi:hypothetical protein
VLFAIDIAQPVRQTARKHLAAGNVDAYKAYMRAMFRRAMSQRTINQLLAALKQDGIEI